MANIKRNAVFNILLSVSQILFSVITFPYASRILEPIGIGSYTFVDNYTQYFVWIAGLGIPIYGVREIAKAKTDNRVRSQIFSELFSIHLLFTLGVSFLYVISFLFIKELKPYESFFWLGTTLLISNVFAVEWLFQGLEEFEYIACRAIAIRVLAILAIFYWVKEASDTWLYYMINCAAVAVNALINISLSTRKVSFVRKRFHLRRHFKPLTYIFSSIIVTNVYTLLDSVLLGFLTGTKEVGYYTTAVKLVKILIFIIVAVTTVLIPALSLAYKEERLSDARQLLGKSFDYVCFIGIPLSVGLFVVAEPLIGVFSGNSFLPSIPLLQILAPTIVLIGLNNIFGLQILNPMGQERLFFRATVAGMLVSIGGNFLLIPHFSATGAAIINLCVEFTVMALLAYFVKTRFPFLPNWSHLFKAITACIPFFIIKFAVSLLNINPIAELGIMAVSCLGSYIAVQWWMWENNILAELFAMLAIKKKQD